MTSGSQGTALPPPPRRGGRRPAAPQRASRSLSRASIIDAAMRVLDAEGLDAVTMRRVAAELNTGPASLYAHVADKDELVAALLDRAVGEVEIPDPIDPDRWQEQLKDLARSAVAAFSRHRDIARATLGNIPTTENALVVSNAMMGTLLAGGVSPRVASFSLDILALYFGATAYEDSLEGENIHDGPLGEQFHAELQAFFAALPADRFPHLVSMAEPLTAGEGDERFEFGLDILVRGIASTVASAPKPPLRKPKGPKKR